MAGHRTGVPFPAISGKRTPDRGGTEPAFSFRRYPVTERQNAGVQPDPIPRTVEWRDGAVRLIDQRKLPGRLRFLDCRSVDELCEAISSLAIRGAPALGAAGAYGVALACVTAGGGGDAVRASIGVQAATYA